MITNEVKRIRIDDIKPAPYNPRKLSETAFENLCNSIKQLGLLKPIIVRAENGIIVAGHQRTRAMRHLGYTECDAYIIGGVSTQDECRFNQLHNMCEREIDESGARIRLKCKLNLGVNFVAPSEIEVVSKGSRAELSKELCMLMMRYGDFCTPISDARGNVIISAAYALASKLTGQRLRVMVVDDREAELAKYYFSLDYGKFDYAAIKRETYMQASVRNTASTASRTPSTRRFTRSASYPTCRRERKRKGVSTSSISARAVMAMPICSAAKAGE